MAAASVIIWGGQVVVTIIIVLSTVNIPLHYVGVVHCEKTSGRFVNDQYGFKCVTSWLFNPIDVMGNNPSLTDIVVPQKCSYTVGARFGLFDALCCSFESSQPLVQCLLIFLQRLK